MSETPKGQKPKTFTIQDTNGAHITLTGFLVRQVDGVDVPARDTAVGTEDELLASLREEERAHRRVGHKEVADTIQRAVNEIIRLRAAAGPHFTIHNAAPDDGGDVPHHQV